MKCNVCGINQIANFGGSMCRRCSRTLLDSLGKQLELAKTTGVPTVEDRLTSIESRLSRLEEESKGNQPKE